MDANGNEVCSMPQRVDHPGLYDKQADEAAKLIVVAVNSWDWDSGIED